MWLTGLELDLIKEVARGELTSEVPDSSVGHAVRAESHDATDDRAGEDVVPVVVLVDGERTADQASA